MVTWPDFTSLPNDLTPVLKLIEIAPEHPFTINGLTIRAVKVSHIVPTAGYIVEDKDAAIAFSSDTGPTHRFWELVNGVKNLKAVITDAGRRRLAVARRGGSERSVCPLTLRVQRP